MPWIPSIDLWPKQASLCLHTSCCSSFCWPVFLLAISVSDFEKLRSNCSYSTVEGWLCCPDSGYLPCSTIGCGQHLSLDCCFGRPRCEGLFLWFCLFGSPFELWSGFLIHCRGSCFSAQFYYSVANYSFASLMFMLYNDCVQVFLCCCWHRDFSAG